MRRSPPRTIRLGEPDLALLAFLAEHRFVLPDHAAALLERARDTARIRLARLEAGGYARSVSVFSAQPPMYLITRAGLASIASTLPPPRPDVRVYQHDVGVAWLWLDARAGTFGPVREITAERRLRSHDGAREPQADPLGVRLGGFGARGHERLHYPDLLLDTGDGRRIALELELSSKGPKRLEPILAGYAADPRIDGVVYLVESATVARSVVAMARRLGIASLVHLQRVRFSERPAGEARGGVTAAARQARGAEAAL